MILAKFRFTFLFRKIIPPKALLESLLNDLIKAFSILFAEATPQGLVCLRIMDVGSRNSFKHLNPLSRSIRLL